MPIVCRYYVYCVALPDGGADAIRATIKCTFTYCVTYNFRGQALDVRTSFNATPVLCVTVVRR